MDALPDAQPMVSKHLRQYYYTYCQKISMQSKSHCCFDKTAYCLQASNTFAASWYSKWSTATFYNISSTIHSTQLLDSTYRGLYHTYLYSHSTQGKNVYLYRLTTKFWTDNEVHCEGDHLLSDTFIQGWLNPTKLAYDPH